MKNGIFTKQDFQKAAKLLDSSGLVKNSFCLDGKYCAIGALCDAARTEPMTVSARNFSHEAYQVLGSLTGIFNYNDKETTTKDDVVTLLLLLGEMS